MLHGEFALIDKIRRRAGSHPEISLGIGDDCSALRVPCGEELLTSTDLLLEDVHFRLAWTDFYSLGIKTVAVNISDIAAMGARPLSLHLAVGLPAQLSTAQVDQFLDGVFAALAKYKLTLIGGDTCRSQGGMMIAVTVQGVAPTTQIVRRNTAERGDDLWVSGSLGDSALALQQLCAGNSLSAFLAQRHHRPVARLELGQSLARQGIATAMLDLSDGLSGDLRHLLDASGVGAQVELQRLPLSSEFRVELNREPALIDLALCGGEDYELLFTANPQKRGTVAALAAELGLPLHRIGSIVVGTNLHLCQVDGQRYQPQKGSFNHFSPTKDSLCE